MFHNDVTKVHNITGPLSRYDMNVQHDACKTIPVVFTVDSRTAADKSKYTVELPSEYRDVVSIELIKALIPVEGTDLYTIIRVNNWSRVIGNTNALQQSFCAVYCPDPGNNNYHTLHRTGCEPDDAYTYYFREPARIRRLDIELIRPDGTAPLYAADQQHVLTFEIRTLIQHRKLLC